MGGDGADTRALLPPLIPRLRRFAHALTGARHDGDDLAQATLERALRNIDRFEPGTRLDSWLFRIAHNLWIDEVRSRRRRGEVAEIDGDAITTGGEAAALDRLTLAQVQAEIAAMAPEHRAVLALVAIEGLAYREAAAVLDIPIGTVMSRLARARRALAIGLEGAPS